MAPRSSRERQDCFEVRARKADEQAALASTPRLAERWRHIAETYRWIAYHQKVFGRWRPPVSEEKTRACRATRSRPAAPAGANC